MKKSLKPVLVFVLLFFTSSALIVLGYVGIKLDCEVLVKEKIIAQERMETGLNQKIALIAEYQLLTSEERIVEIAEQELGMIRDSSNNLRIVISAAEVSRLSETAGIYE